MDTVSLQKIISHAVRLYYRFCLSSRDVEDLLAEREIVVSYETIRQWCLKFGPEYARRLIRRQSRLGDTWHLDELFVTIRGQQHYLWRAVDQDGDVIGQFVQSLRDRRVAQRFFRNLLKGQGRGPWRLVTDKLSSYAAAHRTLMPCVIHDTGRYANNRAEVSHQPTRQRERQMRRFKSSSQAQRFLSVHGITQNLFRVGRHLLRATNQRLLQARAFPSLEDGDVCMTYPAVNHRHTPRRSVYAKLTVQSRRQRGVLVRQAPSAVTWRSTLQMTTVMSSVCGVS